MKNKISIIGLSLSAALFIQAQTNIVIQPTVVPGSASFVTNPATGIISANITQPSVVPGAFTVTTNSAGQVSVALPTGSAAVTNPATGIVTFAQPGIGATIESYLVDNDPTFNGWSSNHFTLIEAAKFANVNGTPGASSEGNVVGLEIPIHKWSVHIDALADFEQLAGDVHSFAIGAGYDYNIHQIHLSAGLDVQDVFANNHIQAMPYVELIKMPTTLYGLAPFLRWQYPISRAPGGGEFLVGIGLNL